MAERGVKLDKHEKWLIALTVGFLGLVVPLVWWWQAQTAMPRITIPTPVLPNPNAYDFYVKAGSGLKIDAVEKALMAIDDGESPYGAGVTAPTGRPHPRPTRAELRRELTHNAPALATLRQGLQYRYYEPPARSFNHLFPHYAKHRALVRLLVVDAYVRAEQGDWAGATRNYLDAIQMGEEMPRGGPMIGMLVGVACAAIGRKPSWDAIDHLNAAQAKAAARRLEGMLASHVTFADVLQEEKWLMQASLLEIFRQKNWRKTLASYAGSSGGPDVARFYFVSKREAITNLSGYTDELIANAREPYILKGKTEPPLPGDPVSQLLAPVFAKAGYKDVYNVAQNRLLLTALALRAYKLEHGRYPEKLTQLVPGYLHAVPEDPFALHMPLAYQRKGARYLLFSIGPDGKYNNGTPCTQAKRYSPGTSSRHNYVNENSTGDIVAGVNW